MARKRGGLAGLYDRNKGLVRTAAILGGTALGGPAGGAAAGAAFRGLDRPGKRGIGFDVGQGLRGAAEGYTIGKTAVGAKQAIGKMLAPKAAALPSLAAPDSLGVVNTMLPSQATTPLATGGMGAIGNAAVAPDVGSLASKAAGQVVGQSPKLGRVESILSKVEKYPKAFEMMQSALPDPQAQARIDAEMMRAKSDEDRARLDRERFALEQRMMVEGGQRQANLLRALRPGLADILGLNNAPGSPATRTASPFISGAGPMSPDDAVRDFGAPNYQSLASIQGAVPGFGRYADMDEGDDEVAPLRTGVAPLRTGVAPLRTSVSPLSSTVSPMQTSVRPLRR